MNKTKPVLHLHILSNTDLPSAELSESEARLGDKGGHQPESGLSEQSVWPEADALPAFCIPDAHGHCITCSDEALPYTVVRVDAEQGLAEVLVGETGEAREEIDITLVEQVVPGSVVLVHGGVAIALLSEVDNE